MIARRLLLGGAALALPGIARAQSWAPQRPGWCI